MPRSSLAASHSDQPPAHAAVSDRPKKRREVRATGELRARRGHIADAWRRVLEAQSAARVNVFEHACTGEKSWRDRSSFATSTRSSCCCAGCNWSIRGSPASYRSMAPAAISTARASRPRSATASRSYAGISTARSQSEHAIFEVRDARPGDDADLFEPAHLSLQVVEQAFAAA
jgi:hypothetical protein